MALNAKALWRALLFSAILSSAAVAAASPALSQGALDRAIAQYGEGAGYILREWQTLLKRARLDTALAERQKLEIVNDFFNRVRWVSDREHWGMNDYWATPVETLASNGGDCEDFSIGKYVSLKAIGIPMDRLRITYVKALTLNQAHMVLAYYPSQDAEPLILDNLNPQILPASSRPDLVLFYSFNADRLWLAKERDRPLHIGQPSRLKPWISVTQRISLELAQQ